MIARLRPRRRRDDGAAAVEFAILVPVLLMITFGIIAVGLILWSLITANQAAREATRRIVVNDETLTDCDALDGYITDRTSFEIENMTVTSDGGIGDPVTLTFAVPTDETSVGAFAAVTSLIPGGSVFFPSELNVTAEGRIEETSALATGGCP